VHRPRLRKPKPILIPGPVSLSSKWANTISENTLKLSHELRFGIAFLPDVPWDEFVRRFLYIEELGFDIAGFGDHFAHFFYPSQPWFEAWTLLSALATQTSKIRIGTLVTPIAWRNPAFLARQAMTVDHISNGRLELGLGSGVRSDRSYEMTGIPNWSPRERVARFSEYVEIVDQLLRNKVTNYEGQYYKVKEAVMSPRPVQKPRPPITIAALRPRMLKLAARYADTWTTLGPAERLEEVRHRNELIDRYCGEMDRDPTSLRRSIWFYYSDVEKQRGLFCYYESEEAFREMVRPYMDMGMTEVLLSYPYREEQLPVFEKIAREEIPELKAKYNK
jgi:alkanesulfonate monooxygenase SsuD/methylene tetrahydromethanopterin reductase-like flavin-dependent oxidoreductase (luciferase family)